MDEKRAYVRSQRQTRNHTCHWPGCERQVPPAMWGCKPHWMTLPKYLRDRIWDTYEVGQEQSLTPSDAYLASAHEVDEWISARFCPDCGERPEASMTCRHGAFSVRATKETRDE